MKSLLPSVFVSHGAPTLPFDDVPARTFLRGLGNAIGKPEAIVCVSAHWDTQTPDANTPARNTTIHDFGGFPEELYRIRYDAPGAPALARAAESLLAEKGLQGTLDPVRGLDHGAWVPLMLMYPDSDIPTIQISVQSHESPAHHIALGRALAPLREQNVLLLGSGGFVHNLRLLDRGGMNAPEPEWSSSFADWMHGALMSNREDDLAHYRARAPQAQRAHPTEEHLMPLFVAYGAGGKDVKRLHKSTTFGSLRMDAYSFA
jgi:4,5-DOPA dioxygenase extradiol